MLVSQHRVHTSGFAAASLRHSLTPWTILQQPVWPQTGLVQALSVFSAFAVSLLLSPLLVEAHILGHVLSSRCKHFLHGVNLLYDDCCFESTHSVYPESVPLNSPNAHFLTLSSHREPQYT